MISSLSTLFFNKVAARLMAVTAIRLSLGLATLAASPCAHAASAKEKAVAENEACNLLTLEEISRATGSPARRPRPDTAEKGSGCSFSIGIETLRISLWPTTREEFEEFRKLISESYPNDVETVSGVGDQAYWWTNRIYVRKGSRGLTVFFGNSRDSVHQNDRDRVLAVAKAALAKLR